MMADQPQEDQGEILQCFADGLVLIRSDLEQQLSTGEDLERVIDRYLESVLTLFRQILEGVGSVHAFCEVGLPAGILNAIFEHLTRQQPAGFLTSLGQSYRVFALEIGTVIDVARGPFINGEMVAIAGRLISVLESLSTPESLQSFFETYPASSNSYVGFHAVLHGHLELMRDPLWQSRFSRSNMTSFNAIFQSFMDTARRIFSHDGYPIAIMTAFQFNSTNPPPPGTTFQCSIHGQDVRASLPGQSDNIIGTCTTFHWNRYILEVLQDQNYIIRGFWGEDFSVFGHDQPPRGERFKVTLVCYVSADAEPGRRLFSDFQQRFGIQNVHYILPWEMSQND